MSHFQSFVRVEKKQKKKQRTEKVQLFRLFQWVFFHCILKQYVTQKYILVNYLENLTAFTLIEMNLFDFFFFFHEKNTLRKSNYVFMIFTMRNDSNDKETNDCCAITEVRIFYVI